MLQKSRHYKVLFQVLLDQGAEVDAVDGGYETPLHKASRYNHPETVQVTKTVAAYGMHVPCCHLESCFQLLLDNDADIEALEDDGLTPLQGACVEGSLEAAEVQR